jgi:hypothetical protein
MKLKVRGGLFRSKYDWFPPNPEGLSDVAVLSIAVGKSPGASNGVSVNDIPRLTRKKMREKIREAGARIALRELALLASGERVETGMKFLAAMWADQQLNGRRRGRPKSSLQDDAIQSAYCALVDHEPGRSIESIVSELGAVFGLSRAQIFKIIRPVTGDLLSSLFSETGTVKD